MAITFNSQAITVVNGDYTFEDIYLASLSAGNTYCRKLGGSYLISTDLLLGDEITPTTLTAENISVTIEGDLFQVKEGAVLTLGTIDNLGSTGNGVFLSCPNIKNGYGFGSDNRIGSIVKSGNLFAYASTLDIYGFWGFFSGPAQHCEIINCNINGFGRIEGPNSIIRNITTTASNGRFGVLAPKGTIAEYSGVKSLKSKAYSGHTCSVYFNPEYAPSMRVTGGEFDGYTEGLVYSEPWSGTAEAGTITFIDSIIKNGYGGYYGDNNTTIVIAYTFEPTFIDSNNNIMTDVSVTIVDNNGTEVFSGLSAAGKIKAELISHTENNFSFEDYVYFDVTAEANGLSITRRFRTNTTYIDFPFFVIEEGSSTGDCCLDDIQTKLDTMQAAVFQKIEDEAGTTITHIDNSIEDSHDRLVIKANNNRDSIINIVVNGDGISPTNQDIIDEINQNEVKIDELADSIEMTSNGWKII